MKLLFNPNPKGPEIELSDSPDGLRKLGQLLLNLDKEIELSAEQVCDDVYPCSLKGLVLKINNDRQDEDLLYISVVENNLVIEGTSIALRTLGKPLSRFDDNTPDGYHLHYDYFPGVTGLLAPTNFSLIVSCQR